MTKKNLKLEDLKVQSFVTLFEHDKLKTVKGGSEKCGDSFDDIPCGDKSEVDENCPRTNGGGSNPLSCTLGVIACGLG